MPRKPGTIVCDAATAPASAAGSLAGDLHDAIGHHRYYGSSVESGGERIVESRRGKRPSVLAIFGF